MLGDLTINRPKFVIICDDTMEFEYFFNVAFQTGGLVNRIFFMILLGICALCHAVTCGKRAPMPQCEFP